MSCIAEISKRKESGDSSVPGIYIEGGGNYKGHEYLITFRDIGFRCGYVAFKEDHWLSKCFIEEDHLMNGMPDEVEDIPHGGVTFFGHSHIAEKLLGHSCSDIWVGFDAGHAGDSFDKECLIKYFDKETANRYSSTYWSLHDEDEIKDYSYMENKCKKLIDKVIELGNKNED